MATKSFDPTANPFELLASAESQDAAVARKKPVRKQEAEAAQPVGATVLTPAEKAKARAAKEAAKTTKQENSPAPASQDKDAPKKKLTREQYLEEKRKGTLVEGSEPSDSPATRPARARGDQSGQNSGNHRGGRGGRGGRGRGMGRGRGGEGDKSGRALGDKEHHHQPPVHGREYDKKSGMKTGRHAVAKKGGVGSQNWGDDKDDLAGQTGGADTVDIPADEAEKTNVNQTEVAQHTEEQKEEEVDNSLTFDDYLKTKATQDAQLAAKVGNAPAPRKVEAPADLDKYVDPHADQAKPAAAAAEKKKEDIKKSGPKFVALDEVFNVRTPPPLSTRGRGGRGRGGRGGRGGGEGGHREGGHREGGHREGGHREGGNREGGNREGGHREGGNREGGHREGGNREGGHREGGNREGGDQHRGDQRGRGRGGRGQGRGQRRVQLDSNLHFPDLGSN